MTEPDRDRVTVGALAGAFGVKGEVRLKSFCADPEAIADYLPLVTDRGERIDQLVLTGRIANGFSARLGGVLTKEDADALRGRTLLADRARLPDLPDDEYYHADLVGLEVRDTGGTILGTVAAVHNHGAGDLIEIRPPGQSDTVLLPFTQELVPAVDLRTGRIVADPPDGLF